MLSHGFNPIKSRRIWGQFGLHSEFLDRQSGLWRGTLSQNYYYCYYYYCYQAVAQWQIICLWSWYPIPPPQKKKTTEKLGSGGRKPLIPGPELVVPGQPRLLKIPFMCWTYNFAYLAQDCLNTTSRATDDKYNFLHEIHVNCIQNINDFHVSSP